jgi:3D (Asp-Asp-Asp) domain-containing protein
VNLSQFRILFSSRIWLSVLFVLVFTAVLFSLADAQDAQTALTTTDGLTIVFDNGVVQIDTCPQTIGDLFEIEGIDEDPEIFGLSPITQLSPGQIIIIEGLTVAEASSEIEIPAPVMFRYELTTGDQAIEVTDEGKSGIERIIVRQYFMNGTMVGESRHSKVILEPVRKLVIMPAGPGIGYSPTFEELLNNPLLSRELSPPARYEKKLQCEATAYYPGVDSNGSWGNQTAMGYECMPGRIAVDPNVIPLGSRLFVENYGYCVAVDTGGAIKGNIIDVCFWTREECINWGRRDVVVYVL